MKKPAIALPKFDDKTLNRIISAIKETIEIREGDRGDPEDRFISVRDLKDSGVVVYTGAGANFKAASAEIIATVDLRSPPAPEGLTATGAFTSIHLTWDQWDYGNHSHTEIFRSATDDIGVIQSIGTSLGRQYVDSVDPGDAYYYWIRFVSEAGVEGSYNATDGVSATSTKTVDSLLTEMGDTVNNSDVAKKVLEGYSSGSEFYIASDVFGVIKPTDDGTIMVPFSVSDIPAHSEKVFTNGVRQPATYTTQNEVDTANNNIPEEADYVYEFIDTVTGIFLNAETIIKKGTIGSALIGDVTVDKLLRVPGEAFIFAADIDSATITTAHIDEKLESTNFSNSVSGYAGWHINKNGTAIFNNITIKNASGATIMSSGTGVDYTGLSNLPTLGTLSTKDSVDYTDVGGTKPAADADKTSDNIAASITDQGAFATVDKLLSDTDIANHSTKHRPISTYIADLAVDSLQIAGRAVTDDDFTAGNHYFTYNSEGKLCVLPIGPHNTETSALVTGTAWLYVGSDTNAVGQISIIIVHYSWDLTPYPGHIYNAAEFGYDPNSGIPTYQGVLPHTTENVTPGLTVTGSNSKVKDSWSDMALINIPANSLSVVILQGNLQRTYSSGWARIYNPRLSQLWMKK